MRIAYIFTTFPKLSEQFFLREVLELQRQGVELGIYSIYGGSDESEAGPVHRMHLVDWFKLIIETVYWSVHQPGHVWKALRKCWPFGYGSWTNYAENALGIAFAIRYARHFEASGYRYLHATWATAPGAVTHLTHQLAGVPYTLEAHAYDVFRDGGDAFLLQKLQAAQAVRSSTEATSGELLARFGGIKDSSRNKQPQVHCIRRGLHSVPDYKAPKKWAPGTCLRVISVGRLIEKKGYFKQLEVYRELQSRGIEFEAKIVGEGPLHRPLSAEIIRKGLKGKVCLVGKLDFEEVVETYRQSHLLIFSGLISQSGDRDGFPNVIGEAMAHSLPVFSSDVSGTTEGVSHGVTGTIVDFDNPVEAADEILSTMGQSEKTEMITLAAYRWIISNFNVATNVGTLKEALWRESYSISQK